MVMLVYQIKPVIHLQRIGSVQGGSNQHIRHKKGMAYASLNVNGLRSHLDEVKLLIRDLGLHILALNETKLDHNLSKELPARAHGQSELWW